MNENQNAASEQATDDASKAATPSYESWQQKHDAALMDGTQTQSTYIRLASGDGIEYGMQPRVGICHSGHLHLSLYLRVAFQLVPLADPTQPIKQNEGLSDVAETSKADQLRNFVAEFNWVSADARRISGGMEQVVPLTDKGQAGASELRHLLDNNLLFDAVLQRLPVPAAGWDPEQLALARAAYHDYVANSVQQFRLFREVKTTVYDLYEAPALAELPPKLVAFLTNTPQPALEQEAPPAAE